MPGPETEPDAPYTSTLLMGVGVERCTRALRTCGLNAFVAGNQQGTTVYPDIDGPASDQHHVGRALSETCQAPALSVWADPWQPALQYRVFLNGDLLTQGRSDTYGTGSTGDLPVVSALVGQESADVLSEVLTGRYSDPEELHREFLLALGLSDASVGWGYESLKSDGIDYPGPSLMAVGADEAPTTIWSRDFERSAGLVHEALVANSR